MPPQPRKFAMPTATPSPHRPASLMRRAAVCLLLLLTAAWAGPASGAPAVVVRGREPAGPKVVLVVPAPAHRASIGLARQLATLSIERGALTLVEAAPIPPDEELADLLSDALPQGEPPDWVWVHRGSDGADARGEKVAVPTIGLQAAEPFEGLDRIARRALGADAIVSRAEAEGQPARVGRGLLTFRYPAGTPQSRQIRHTRQLAVALLQTTGLTAEDARFEWDGLRGCAPRLLAVYDAEGIGGSGPPRLERIAAERLDGAGVYRVCGEDIRDGALGPATGVVFPGGSGRGIGDGLQAEGRQRVRDFLDAGGGYLGVCAGAYFAGSGLDNYLHAIRLRHSQPWTRGRDMVDIELTPEGQALFGAEQSVLRTRYANGPVFLAADQPDGGDPDFVVLARFKTASTDGRGQVRDEMVGEAAIGARNYGRGRLLIISPHPETHPEHHAFVARALEWTLESAAGSEPASR